MVVSAASLWAINGTISKVVLASGLSPYRLAELRCAGAAALFLGAPRCSRRPLHPPRRAKPRKRPGRVLPARLGFFPATVLWTFTQPWWTFPGVASLVAFAWLGESLGAGQIVGGVLVLLGVALVQTARR